MAAPNFWDTAASEPKRQHRFMVYMGNVNGYEPYIAKSVTKPSFELSETEHKYLGNTYYFPGVVTWNEITLTIVNTLSPDAQSALLEALSLSGYVYPNASESDLATPNKEAATVDGLGTVMIEELDGNGEKVASWTLNNAFIKSATFGDLDYSGDELLNVEIGIRYDWATYEGDSTFG